jgi:PEP-CTERM motif
MHLSGSDGQKITADLASHGVTENLALADLSGKNQLAVDPSFAAIIEEAGGPNLSEIPVATFDTQANSAVAAAPEPAQLGLVAVGLISFGMRMRQKKYRNVSKRLYCNDD